MRGTKAKTAQSARVDACVRPPPKWIYILKIVIKWMRFGRRVQRTPERDFHCKVHQLCDVNQAVSEYKNESGFFSIPSSSSSTSSTWHDSSVTKSGGLFVFMLKNTSAYNGQKELIPNTSSSHKHRLKCQPIIFAPSMQQRKNNSPERGKTTREKKAKQHTNRDNVRGSSVRCQFICVVTACKN